VSARAPRPPRPLGPPRVAVFAPHPELTVTLEREGTQGESIHFHPGGQGVWVSRIALELGAAPILCAFAGGEPGRLLGPLIDGVCAQLRLVHTDGACGCYVTDRRSGERELLACVLSPPPSRHELDELFSLTCAEAGACGWLVVTNPLPADALPLEIYGDLVADAAASGARTLVDLSSPRLDSALRGRPDVVRLNDWELAEYVSGPVSEPDELLAAARRLQAAGAARVVVTRGEHSGLVLDGERAWELRFPAFARGHREGCGDAMMGAMAAAWARGESFERAVVVGAGAGAANFLRHGLGSATAGVIERLAEQVSLVPWGDRTAVPA
jgi:1-phosphofructokinase